jgi:hypothetical protein
MTQQSLPTRSSAPTLPAPAQETVMLVMMPGQRTRAYKVQAAMADVSEVTEDTAA